MEDQEVFAMLTYISKQLDEILSFSPRGRVHARVRGLKVHVQLEMEGITASGVVYACHVAGGTALSRNGTHLSIVKPAGHFQASAQLVRRLAKDSGLPKQA